MSVGMFLFGVLIAGALAGVAFLIVSALAASLDDR